MTYRIEWHRGAVERENDDWASFDCVTARRGSDAWTWLLAVLRNMRYRDGPWAVFDQRGVMCWSGDSIYAAARRFFPTAAEQEQAKAGRKRRD